MQNVFKSLIDDYSYEEVIQTAEQLLNNEYRKRGGQYHEMLTPEKITDSLQFVDHALSDLHETGSAVQDAYSNRGDLIKQITELKTSIELDEAEAFMMLDGNKVEMDGRKVTLSNDKMRTAYQQYVARDKRMQLAELEGDLKRIEIEIAKAKDKQDDAKQSADLMKARLYVTANLLKFLS